MGQAVYNDSEATPAAMVQPLRQLVEVLTVVGVEQQRAPASVWPGVHLSQPILCTLHGQPPALTHQLGVFVRTIKGRPLSAPPSRNEDVLQT